LLKASKKNGREKKKDKFLPPVDHHGGGKRMVGVQKKADVARELVDARKAMSTKC